MPPTEKQFSIGKLIYITAFVATIVATLLSKYPYGFIYPIGFVLITSAYIIWSITRPLADVAESIVYEWEMERLAEEEANSDSVEDQS